MSRIFEFEVENTRLQTRLGTIIQTIPHFWEQRTYTHFTNHGPEHSERVLNQKIAQLAQGLPLEKRLTEDEIFIISAAAWLYEVGMQSPNLQPVLDFAYEPGAGLSMEQLLQIRERRHLLTRQLIADSIRPNYAGPAIRLGLNNEPDDYTRVIAEVCRWCSLEDLGAVDKFIPVNGIEVRLRLMVALLRLADQLYIDSARVNRERLLAFHLPPQTEARWWAYHYTQILPINKGKIRFYYSLPLGQRQYLGHIRALIEPTFDYTNNALIRYLDEEHDLSLSVQQQPQVRLDQQEGFLQEMPWEMVGFLRANLKPIESKGEDVELVGYTETKTQERHPLLVLDYENMLLQLGLDGYYPTLDEWKKLIIALTVKAHETLGDLADLWALGHWQRPDMQAIKHELEQLTYQLKPLYDDQQDLLRGDFAPLLQRTNAPSKALLVAPREELGPVIKQFKDRDVPVMAWLGNGAEMSIFRVITRQPQTLAHMIPLPTTTPVEMSELQALLALCILRLDDAVQRDGNGGLAITTIVPMFNDLRELQGHGAWWQTWLLNQGILLCEETPQGYRVRLEGSHKAVRQVREQRSLVIKTLQRLANAQHDVAQTTLLQHLTPILHEQERPERITRFCQFLQRSGLLDAVTNDLSDIRWRLNEEHWSVLAENSEFYLPLLLLGIDHYLLCELRHPCIHEHILAGKLDKYLGYHTVRPIYQLALKQGLVACKNSTQTFHGSDDHLVEVRLVEQHAEVRQTLRNCYILLRVIYSYGQKGFTRDELWASLIPRMQRCFTLSALAFDRWLTVFQNRDLLRPKLTGTQMGEPARLLLNLDNPLAMRLLARPQLLNLIKQIRIIRRDRPGIPASEILSMFTQHVTHDAQISRLTLQFAREQRIVILTRQKIGDNSVDQATLDHHHPFIQDLERRNLATCTVLKQLLKDMSGHFPQGRVPEHKVLQAMEHDSRYGIAHEEYLYWLQQAIHKYKLLEDNSGRGFTGPTCYWVKEKPITAEVK